MKITHDASEIQSSMHRTAAVQLLKPEHVPQACDFLTLMINGKSQRVPALVLCEDEFMVLIDLRAEAIGNELGRTPAREAVVEGECWQREIWGLDGHDIFRACYELRQDLYRQVPVLPNPLVVAVVGFISCPLALLIGLKYASHQTQRRPMLPRPKLQTMACEGNRASVSVFRVHPSCALADHDHGRGYTIAMYPKSICAASLCTGDLLSAQTRTGHVIISRGEGRDL
ncbi:hypothetical protein MPTK1_1g22540 [Marchantia polymorpha subsp. ruderalis]|uniref:Uncharacterized protein n=2 Tax=Marchantia polymorpha TaxID=3197 RepID=A0AAF6AT57_MARPO|nr:hypothetical protein MARPO_0118s0033 [Marchantia polymorpha]PTQ30899.1 hypothetical protein MARPO_0118s0033 [Marchantia polymorpha]BBM99626.1 hypothetical protein Mp_1g22540 [Marchantia polymorpha subsp. ruderalis]BBM99627.1 hypothetical protein Mp_1g22540 [Marchantia polymorpha subsp. ruderalis]|eukprot:PTQ30898.1 hypothetical protein MARPO_0118s0033 [Marchantia polymorpha]